MKNTYKVNEEAVKKIAERVYDNGSTVINRNDLEEMFPALKESEDEKIRNWLIRTLKSLNSTAVQIDGAYEMMLPAIAWLERVAKPADKQGEQKPAVPKFRIGDKVKKGYLTYTVEDIDEDSYKLQAYSKDGEKGCTVFLSIGYEKDYELVEQKSAEWHREDEQNLNACLGYIPDEFLRRWLTDAIHVKYEKPAEWSSRDDSYFEELTEASGLNELQIEWLTEIKDRVLQQPKQEWSEEDEKMLKSLIAALVRIGANTRTDTTSINYTFSREIDWLKSLKERYTWKPSERQIEALVSAIDIMIDNRGAGDKNTILLSGLYHELKTL